MILTQAGTSVVISFVASSATAPITLKNMTIEQLGNIAGSAISASSAKPPSTDSLDIWGASRERDRLFTPSAPSPSSMTSTTT